MVFSRGSSLDPDAPVAPLGEEVVHGGFAFPLGDVAPTEGILGFTIDEDGIGVSEDGKRMLLPDGCVVRKGKHSAVVDWRFMKNESF